MSNEVKNREEREKWVGLENLFQTLEFVDHIHSLQATDIKKSLQ